jgi:hypothetical protein
MPSHCEEGRVLGQDVGSWRWSDGKLEVARFSAEAVYVQGLLFYE